MASDAPEIQRSFTGGELSPELQARADLARYKNSLATEENFVSLVRGGATRRSGFLDIGAPLDAYSRMLPFAFSDSDAYAVEFGVGKAQFWRDYGILLSGGAPYQIVTPFIANDLPNLCPAQSANALYITCGSRPMQTLVRNGVTSWAMAAAVFRNGPFRDENADTTITLTGSHSGDLVEGTAGIAVVASAPVFDPLHVGALFFIRANDQSASGQWLNDSTQLTTNDKVYWGDNFYKCTGTNGTKTGENPPIHLVGSQWDGSKKGSDNSRLWTYLHSGWGVIKITAVTDSTHATATAMSYVPDEFKTGVYRWAEGAFSDYRGHPQFCAIHKQRLYLWGNTADPTGYWASVIDDYTNHDAHTGGNDSAFKGRLEGNSGKVNVPRWLQRTSSGRLAIGTAGDEHVLSRVTGSAIGPDNVEVDDATTEGAAPAQAVRIEGVVFIAADTERVVELADDPNSIQTNAMVANDLTIYADHIGAPGLAQLVWQREPYRLLWVRGSDGSLASCTYRKDQSVLAWSRHPTTKGSVQDICAVPSPIKKRQDLWAITSRALAAGTVRRVECLMPFFQKTDKIVANAFMVDAGLIHAGAPATTFAMGARYNGETVAILADGKVQPNQVVAGGNVVLSSPASAVIVGLPLTARLRTLRCDKDTLGGPLSGRDVRASAAVVDVMDAAGVKARAGDKDFELLKPSGGANMDAPAGLFTGALKIDALESDWSDSDIEVLCDQPLPATVRAITPIFQVRR